MDRDDIVRTDFPEADPGFEKSSVEAHLEAVAAQLAALEARARALEVELDAVRGEARTAPNVEPTPEPTPEPATDPAADGGTPGSGVEGGGSDPVAARLVATELALDGVERNRIVERIEADYGIPDAARLVDEVIARTS